MHPVTFTRRDLIAGSVGALFGCGRDPEDCAGPASSDGEPYCLVRPLRVRVPGAATLAEGEAVLFAADEDTAVIVARDSDGLHALSGICTHACCVVSLCADAGCTSLTTTPSGCAATRVTAPDPQGGILCPCHGSTFRISDGAALSPPATTPLPAWSVQIEGDDVVVDTAQRVDPTVRV